MGCRIEYLLYHSTGIFWLQGDWKTLDKSEILLHKVIYFGETRHFVKLAANSALCVIK